MTLLRYPAIPPVARPCTTCDEKGEIQDPTACSDREHCYPFMDCPDCDGLGAILL